jgi:hypothetical protein
MAVVHYVGQPKVRDLDRQPVVEQQVFRLEVPGERRRRGGGIPLDAAPAAAAPRPAWLTQQRAWAASLKPTCAQPCSCGSTPRRI